MVYGRPNRREGLARAYARVRALKARLPDLPFVSHIYVDEFHSALEQLRRLGQDVRDFQVPPELVQKRQAGYNDTTGEQWFNEIPEVERAYLLMKIDGLLDWAIAVGATGELTEVQKQTQLRAIYDALVEIQRIIQPPGSPPEPVEGTTTELYEGLVEDANEIEPGLLQPLYTNNMETVGLGEDRPQRAAFVPQPILANISINVARLKHRLRDTSAATSTADPTDNMEFFQHATESILAKLTEVFPARISLRVSTLDPTANSEKLGLYRDTILYLRDAGLVTFTAYANSDPPYFEGLALGTKLSNKFMELQSDEEWEEEDGEEEEPKKSLGSRVGGFVKGASQEVLRAITDYAVKETLSGRPPIPGG
jgi:hypothetical protein